MLEGKNITYKVGPSTLLNDVSIWVEAGQLLAIVGPNGAGKSTLVKVLSGDLQAQHGHVVFSSKPLKQWDRRKLARTRGIFSQELTLNFSFRVLEVVELGRYPHFEGAARDRDHEIVRAALEAVQMWSLRHRIYTTLSGGERQRVQLARVLAQIWEPVDGLPRLLIMDEPTNNLDRTHQHLLLRLARSFTQKGVGVLTVLHDLNLASQYADQVLLMNMGRCIAQGTPDQVLTPDMIQGVFNVSVKTIPHPDFGFPLVLPS